MGWTAPSECGWGKGGGLRGRYHCPLPVGWAAPSGREGEREGAGRGLRRWGAVPSSPACGLGSSFRMRLGEGGGGGGVCGGGGQYLRPLPVGWAAPSGCPSPPPAGTCV